MLKRAILILFLLLLSANNLLNAQSNLSRKYANEKVAELRDLLTKSQKTLKAEETDRRREVDRYQAKLKEQRELIERLKGELLRPHLTGPLPKPKPKPGTTTTTPSPPPPLPATPDISYCKNRIKELEANIKFLNSSNTSLKLEISQLKNDLLIQKDTIQSLNQRITAIRLELNGLKQLYNTQQGILNCFYATSEEKIARIDAAQSDLKAARESYDDFTRSINDLKNGGLGRKEEDELLTFIFEVYQKYGDEIVPKECGGFPFPYPVSYMTAEDHLIMATILANFPRHLLDNYGSSIDQRVAKSNAELLRHISQIIELGNYDLRARAMRLLQTLPELLVVGASTDVDDSTGTSVLDDYAKIEGYYEEGLFPKVISEYSKYRRFEGEEQMLEQTKNIAAARYCAGMVLLFDQGKVSRSTDLVMPGTFLAREGLKKQIITGIRLLNEVINMTLPEDDSSYDDFVKWQKKAALGLSKSYQHQNKKKIN